MKHSGYNTIYRSEKTVKKFTVFIEIISEVFIDGKDTMAMFDINDFERH